MNQKIEIISLNIPRKIEDDDDDETTEGNEPKEPEELLEEKIRKHLEANKRMIRYYVNKYIKTIIKSNTN